MIVTTIVVSFLELFVRSHIRSLNYSGFFTAILEKDDEVISTATIRIHGNKLAEMPFIGTRKGYWGHGMCRRLLDSIEHVLGSFGVEELIIPSAEGTLRMWTTKFGFKPLKESTKQKMKFMSMAVFAGTTILQKRIPKKKEVEALPDFTGFNKMKLRTRTVKRKTTNTKMELKIRRKRNARAPKMPGYLVEPVFKRTRCPVLRQNAENNVATETSPVGALLSEVMACSLCEENFHISCVEKGKALYINSSCLYFCGTKCREIHTKLNESFGKKTQLQDGFSFSLLKSYDLRKRLNKIDPIKAECKQKLAKAFDILNQCFRPSVDAINNTNIIQHLVYNRGSHIRRLNYSGFFTAILEKDDEVISTATIRIHGNKLAEMPFVGTRIKYWREGMCSRLLDSIENVLGSFGVKELVLPSTDETLQIWTKFGFKPLKESTKQTMKSMSIAVFAGTTILQKRIPKNKNQKLPQISQVAKHV